MATKSITITLEEDLLKELDSFVSQGYYPNRSRSIEGVIREGLKAIIDVNRGSDRIKNPIYSDRANS